MFTITTKKTKLKTGDTVSAHSIQTFKDRVVSVISKQHVRV